MAITVSSGALVLVASNILRQRRRRCLGIRRRERHSHQQRRHRGHLLGDLASGVTVEDGGALNVLVGGTAGACSCRAVARGWAVARHHKQCAGVAVIGASA